MVVFSSILIEVNMISASFSMRIDEVLYKILIHTSHEALSQRIDEIDILEHGTNEMSSTLNDSLDL
jgi:hypothetical protein